MSDDPLDDVETDAEIAEREAKNANNTPADDRVLAMRVLRNIVDNPAAKPQDRAAAAVQLLKAVNEGVGQADAALLQGYDLTDEQLLDVIRVAQLNRETVKQENLVPRGTQVAAPVELPPDHSEKSTLMTISSLEEALAGVPDIDPLCL